MLFSGSIHDLLYSPSIVKIIHTFYLMGDAGPRTLLTALGLGILGIVASGSWYFWYPDLSFGMLGAWRSLGRSWGAGAGEHNSVYIEVQAWIVVNLLWIYGPQFNRFLGLGRSRDTREHSKGHFEVQAWIFINSVWFQGPHFESFLIAT